MEDYICYATLWSRTINGLYYGFSDGPFIFLAKNKNLIAAFTKSIALDIPI